MQANFTLLVKSHHLLWKKVLSTYLELVCFDVQSKPASSSSEGFKFTKSNHYLNQALIHRGMSDCTCKALLVY